MNEKRKRMKVWVPSLNAKGEVRRVEHDPIWGPQYLVSVYNPRCIDETHPFECHWVRGEECVEIQT
jgi:hypothetical protein